MTIIEFLGELTDEMLYITNDREELGNIEVQISDKTTMDIKGFKRDKYSGDLIIEIE